MARLSELFNYESKYTTNDVLKNKLGITDKNKLDKIERVITSKKLVELYLKPKDETFDVKHYLNIHKFLFGDIYEFAGEIRNESIKKDIPFCLPHLIYPNLVNALDRAKKSSDNIKNRDDLVDFITELYPELDIIHPFREGNGRTEREFIRQYTEKICKDNNLENYLIDYTMIPDENTFIKSVIIADARCDTTYLRKFVDMIVVSSNEKEINIKK